MTSRKKTISAGILMMISVVRWLAWPTSLFAEKTIEPSVPELHVRIYSFPGMTRAVVLGAENETERLLRPVRLRLKWIDCTSREVSPACDAGLLPTDLVIRFLAKALPSAHPEALGTADLSHDYGAGFVFYDRVLALRTSGMFLPVALGRVMAHEIGHLLMPEERHAEFGLMRGEWATDNLRAANLGCRGLSRRTVRLMEAQGQRNVLSAHGPADR